MTALFLKSQLYLGGGYSQAGWDAELHPLAGQKSSVLPCADATEVFIFSYYIYIYPYNNALGGIIESLF